MYVCDPATTPHFVVITTNLPEFRLVVRQVAPSEYANSVPGGFYLHKVYKQKYTLEQNMGAAGAGVRLHCLSLSSTFIAHQPPHNYRKLFVTRISKLRKLKTCPSLLKWI